MSPRDVRGAILYLDDEVVELARGQVSRIVSFPAPGKVFLTSGVVTGCDRVEYQP